MTNSKVKNGLAARNLTSYLETCGFNNIKIELFPIIFPSLKDANDNLWIERIADEAADMNFITQVESDLFKQALQIADEKKYFACSINLIIVSAFK